MSKFIVVLVIHHLGITKTKFHHETVTIFVIVHCFAGFYNLWMHDVVERIGNEIVVNVVIPRENFLLKYLSHQLNNETKNTLVNVSWHPW